ncbi:Scr1 family TA system antitoxin-like transcriptional regulator [Streptomyces seoulensis]|uniref:Scr1 family TA system antitoxin-like transcriptional regulator n=1 Tax=Streptomyces seoulensis TaxID=73044 RepID=UPI001F181216|nr:Scr1 family TA system antitoxin-like transcriptional regulator [Streptomyces seoulensis]
MCLGRFTSDPYLDEPSDVQHYSVLHDRLQAQALSPAGSRVLIAGVTRMYIDAASHH